MKLTADENRMVIRALDALIEQSSSRCSDWEALQSLRRRYHVSLQERGKERLPHPQSLRVWAYEIASCQEREEREVARQEAVMQTAGGCRKEA